MTVITSTVGGAGASWGPFEQPIAMKSSRMIVGMCGMKRKAARTAYIERFLTPVLSMTHLLLVGLL
jgi:hypothetical protein